MKNTPVKIKLVKKIANVYVLIFPKLSISLTVNKNCYQRMLNNPEKYEFTNTNITKLTDGNIL